MFGRVENETIWLLQYINFMVIKGLKYEHFSPSSVALPSFISWLQYKSYEGEEFAVCVLSCMNGLQVSYKSVKQ